MVMLFNLGLRRSELTHLKVKDIYNDRGHKVLKILGKGEKYRHLPLNAGVVREIENYIYLYEKSGSALSSEDFLIQTSGHTKNEKPMDGSTIFRMIEKYAKAC